LKTTPRLEIDLDKIEHNARALVERLALRDISVTGITKAVLASPEICEALLRAGVTSLGDSRIENIEGMCRDREQLMTQLILIRTPMLSQVERVVNCVDISFNTEISVIEKLSYFSKQENKMHGIILMVELGDLREGIMPDKLMDVVQKTLQLPNIILKGIGCNLACRSGVVPDDRNMTELSSLAESIEAMFGVKLDIISGGNSANLMWVFNGMDTGRINNIRLGESIFLGCDPLSRQPIDGLFPDAVTLIAEVIESKKKPSKPWGKIAQTAFGVNLPATDIGSVSQSILAIGLQDTDTTGLFPPPGIDILGASSDHIILKSDLPVGAEVRFGVNYSAMLRAMTSPFIAKEYLTPNVRV
jgi:ornithine racemase